MRRSNRVLGGMPLALAVGAAAALLGLGCGGEADGAGGTSAGGGGEPTRLTYAHAEHCGVLHEHAFSRDPELRAAPCHVLGVYLEHPGDVPHEHDSGEAGVDRIPYRLDSEQVFRLCLDDDDGEPHWAVMEDSGGTEVFRVDADQACFDDTLPAGEYVLRLHHGAAERHPFAERLVVSPHLGYSPRAVGKADSYAVSCEPGDEGPDCSYAMDAASCGCTDIDIDVIYELGFMQQEVSTVTVPFTFDEAAQSCVSGDVDVPSPATFNGTFVDTLPSFQLACPGACPCSLFGQGEPWIPQIFLDPPAEAYDGCQDFECSFEAFSASQETPSQRGWPEQLAVKCSKESKITSCPAALPAVRIRANGCPGCNFKGVDFFDDSGGDVNLDWMTFFAGADLTNADFRGADISHLSFDYANLDGAVFYDAAADAFPPMYCTTFQSVDFRQVAGWPDLHTGAESTQQAFLRSLLPPDVDPDDVDDVHPYLWPEGQPCDLDQSVCDRDFPNKAAKRWSCLSDTPSTDEGDKAATSTCVYRGCRTSFAFSVLPDTALPPPTVAYEGCPDGQGCTPFTRSPLRTGGSYASYWRLVNLNGTTWDGDSSFPMATPDESWEGLNLSGARVAGMTMPPARSLRDTSWSNALIAGASFRGVDLSEAALDGARLSNDRPAWSCIREAAGTSAYWDERQAYHPRSNWPSVPLVECPGLWELLSELDRPPGDAAFIYTGGLHPPHWAAALDRDLRPWRDDELTADQLLSQQTNAAWQAFVDKLRSDRTDRFQDVAEGLPPAVDFGGPTDLSDTTWRGVTLRDRYAATDSAPASVKSRVTFADTGQGSPVLDGADFALADLSSADFERASFDGTSLAHAVGAIGTDFSDVQTTLDPTTGDTTLALHQFRGAGADLHGLDLSGADFRGAYLAGASFVGSTLDRAIFGCSATDCPGPPDGCTGDCPVSFSAYAVAPFVFPDEGLGLYAVDFDGASLHHARFASVTLYADPTDPHATSSDPVPANFANAWLDGTDFSGAQLDGAIFTAAIARNTIMHFQSTALPTATDFSGALLTGTSFAGSGCLGCDFTDALLIDVDLSGADLSGSKLNSTFLAGADLSATDLAGADLSFAMVITASNAGAWQYWDYSASSGDSGGALTKVDAALTTASSTPTTDDLTFCPNGSRHAAGCGPLTAEAWTAPDGHTSPLVSEYDGSCLSATCVDADTSSATVAGDDPAPSGKDSGATCGASSECLSGVCIPPLKRCK